MSSSDDNKSPATTQMNNPPKAQAKLVKIKAIQPIRFGPKDDPKIITPGQTAEVSEEDAAEFCDKKFDMGYKDKFGSSEKRDAVKHIVTRAERVK